MVLNRSQLRQNRKRNGYKGCTGIPEHILIPIVNKILREIENGNTK